MSSPLLRRPASGRDHALWGLRLKVTLLYGQEDHSQQGAPRWGARRRPVDEPAGSPASRLALHPGHAGATAERFGDRVAVRDGETTLTYAALAAAARTFGAALVESGVEPGDRVAIWCFNSAEWMVAALGLFAAGAVLVPVNTRFKGAEAADILSRSGARVLVTVTDFLGTDYVAMLEAHGRSRCPHSRRSSSPGGRPPGGAVAWADFLGGATPRSVAEVDRRSAALGPDDPSDILFTSGTTGVPKGVVMTHGRTLRVGHRLGGHDRPRAPATST